MNARTTKKTVSEITVSRLCRERDEFRGLREEAYAKAKAALERGNREGWEYWTEQAVSYANKVDGINRRLEAMGEAY
jgi:hypothetical protein